MSILLNSVGSGGDDKWIGVYSTVRKYEMGNWVRNEEVQEE
jgi:hypothetical protein